MPHYFDDTWVYEKAIPCIEAITDKFSSRNPEDLEDIIFYTMAKQAIMRDLRLIDKRLSRDTFFELYKNNKDFSDSVDMCMDVMLNALHVYFMDKGQQVPKQVLSVIYVNSYKMRINEQRETKITVTNEVKGLSETDVDSIVNKVIGNE